MTSAPNRSLVRRLLSGFAVVLLGVWVGIVLWDLAEIAPFQKSDTQRELRATAYRIMAVVKPIADHPAAIPDVVKRMEALHHTFYFHSWTHRTPKLQTEVWKGRDLLYASAGPMRSSTSDAAGLNAIALKHGWVECEATDPDTGITIRMATQVIPQWEVVGFNSTAYYFNPLLFSLPLLLLPAWLIVRIGLRPLNSIVGEIENRSGSNLSALPSSPYMELSPVVESVNHLMEVLSQRLEREQEFLVDAAHEIKTPLAIVQANTEALDNPANPQRIHEAIDAVRHGVERAAHTMEQLSALSRSDSGEERHDMQPIDLVEVLRDRIELATQIAAPRNMTIALKSPAICMLPLHRESIESLIDNLLNNAVKYSPAGSRIEVALEAGRNAVRLTVTDQGPGIAPEMREKVFERFFRLPGQEVTGSGLGLAIAARAAAKNAGNIRLEGGADGVGLSAVVEFPVHVMNATSTPRKALIPAIWRPFAPLRAAGLFFMEKTRNLRRPSLFRRMLLGFMGVVAGAWLGYLAWNMYDEKTVKIRGMQGELQRSAGRMLVVMDALSRHPEEIRPVIRQIEKLHYAFYDERGWYAPPIQTQIWKEGKLFYVSDDPRDPETLASAAPERQPAKDGWTSAIVTDRNTGVTVRMATELVGDWFLNFASIMYFLMPLLICFPLLALLAWAIIRTGLRPLNRIAGEIESRSSSNLSALTASPYAELAPLVTSANRLMERLKQRLESEHEFLSDAARELRSPVNAMRASLSPLLNDSPSPSMLRQAADELRHAVNRAAHTVHQLLALSRSGSDRDKGDFMRIDLVDLLRGRLALAMESAIPREIMISLHSPDHCVMSMHRESMVSLIDNLMSNAVNCSPPKSRVMVGVKAEKDSVQLIVSDAGPGIPSELRSRVFERFYRLSGHGGEGAGLGLSIVERAAARNFGNINLQDGRSGIGLTAVVEFRHLSMNSPPAGEAA